MQHLEPSLLGQLQALEVELHQPVVRGDAARLDALLHAEFQEFGRSGAAYTKADVLLRLPSAAQHPRVVASNFLVRPLAPDVALLTYRSAHALPDGTLHRHTLRSSIWQRSDRKRSMNRVLAPAAMARQAPLSL
ncbi:nuclear transport factor 2 family protein, partial [Ideonella azotifigens]